MEISDFMEQRFCVLLSEMVVQIFSLKALLMVQMEALTIWKGQVDWSWGEWFLGREPILLMKAGKIFSGRVIQ